MAGESKGPDIGIPARLLYEDQPGECYATVKVFANTYTDQNKKEYMSKRVFVKNGNTTQQRTMYHILSTYFTNDPVDDIPIEVVFLDPMYTPTNDTHIRITKWSTVNIIKRRGEPEAKPIIIMISEYECIYTTIPSIRYLLYGTRFRIMNVYVSKLGGAYVMHKYNDMREIIPVRFNDISSIKSPADIYGEHKGTLVQIISWKKSEMVIQAPHRTYKLSNFSSFIAFENYHVVNVTVKSIDENHATISQGSTSLYVVFNTETLPTNNSTINITASKTVDGSITISAWSTNLRL